MEQWIDGRLYKFEYCLYSMTLKDYHITMETELLKWLKKYCIDKNNNIKPSHVINDLVHKFKEDNS